MKIVTDNVGNQSQMHMISCMNVPKQSQLVKKKQETFYDVHKWLEDVEVEQVVLRISFMIWEMHWSHWETP